MALHQCTDCGLMHDHAEGYTPPQNPDVEIARINAERDVKVAQLAGRQDSNWNETRVEVAEIEAAAEVETAAVQAEVIGEIIAAEGEASIDETAEGGAEPVIVEEISAEPAAEAMPPEIAPSPEPAAKKNVWWG